MGIPAHTHAAVSAVTAAVNTKPILDLAVTVAIVVTVVIAVMIISRSGTGNVKKAANSGTIAFIGWFIMAVAIGGGIWYFAQDVASSVLGK